METDTAIVQPSQEPIDGANVVEEPALPSQVASIDEKPSVAPPPTEEPMEDESASTSPARTSGHKGVFPDVTASIKDGPSTEDIVNPLAMDLVRKQPALDDTPMDWQDDGSERSSVKRQRGSSSSESSDMGDPLRDVVYPSLQRILGVDLNHCDGYIAVSSENFSYMDAISFILDHVITTVLTAPFEDAKNFLGTFESTAVVWDPDVQSKTQAVLPPNEVSSLALMYLLESFERIEEELVENQKKIPSVPASDMIDEARSQVLNYIVLLLTNAFCSSTPITATVLSPFAYFQKPRGLISYLVVKLFNADGIDGDFRLVFEPLLEQLWRAMLVSSTITEDDHKLPLQTLTELCDIKVQNHRPICQLLVQMYNWLPNELAPNVQGREISKISFLAPFLGISCFAEDDIKVVEKFYPSTKNSSDQNKMSSALIQSKLAWVRSELHSIMHYILLDNISRPKMLLYMAQALKRNEKRSRYHLDERVVAGDGYMLNLMSVLQNLSKKIKVDRIDLDYPYHPESLSEVKLAETRLKMNLKEAEEFSSRIKAECKEKMTEATSPSFHSQCYFLALECHHLAIMPSIRKYTRRIRAIREYNRIADELAATEQAWAGTPAISQRNQVMIERWRAQVKKLTKAKYCSDAALLDQTLLSECLNFYCQHMSVLMKAVSGYNTSDPYAPLLTLPLPSNVPEIFSAFPEWYIEDVADFLLFAVQHMPSVVDTNSSNDLVLFLITFVCSSNYVSNPYLVAKIIEVMFVSSPVLHTFTERFYLRIMSHPLAQSHLAAALMKFYVDVESTGASSEFYDKFTIRYHLSVILKSMWADSIHQAAIKKESQNGKQFVKFVNMLMNDTTFLLDESLESLKRIHDVQEAMDKKEEWAKLPMEVQQSKQRQLQSDERQCRSYLTLAVETVDMFHYLTTEIKEPFYRPVRIINSTKCCC